MHGAEALACPLETLLTVVSRLAPSMQGTLVSPSPGCDLGAGCAAAPSPDRLRQMTDYCERAFPEAGRHYCRLHCWGQWIWQPIYLCVIAVYHSDILPLLSQVRLLQNDGAVCGYAICRHAPLRGSRTQRMRWAGAHLCSMCVQLSTAMADTIGVNARAMAAMQADCLLNALLVSRAGDPAVSHARMHRRAAQWLHLCGLDRCSSYFEFPRGRGTALAVRRQTCCHHYRRCGAQHCATCPLLSVDERIMRLTM